MWVVLADDFVVFPSDENHVDLPLGDPDEEYTSYDSGDILPAIIGMCSSGLPFFKVFSTKWYCLNSII